MLGDRFSRFEDQIQQLVEGGFARLFAGRLHPRDVATHLARALEDHVRQDEDGLRVAPDIYIVRLNPQDHQAIMTADTASLIDLPAELVKIARMAGLHLIHTPQVRLLADNNIDPHAIIISAQHTQTFAEITEAMPSAEVRDLISEQPDFKASLLVGEKHQIPLEKPIINLGRQRDNDIIIDFQHVSRHHAQLQLRQGQYVLFDLGSSGGTMVNGRPIKEQPLQSGDVIALAGYTLIYVEERQSDSHNPSISDTLPFSPPAKPSS